MNILVTGSTGFIGHHLVEDLCRLGHSVKCLVRRPEAADSNNGTSAAVVQGDLHHPQSLSKALEDVEAVYHLAGVTMAIAAREYYDGNFIATRNLVSACVDHADHIRQFIHVSSLAALGPSLDGQPLREDTPYHPVSDYGKSKMMGEREVLKAGGRLPVTIVRPSAVYGPGDKGFLEYMRMVKHGVLTEVGFQKKLLNLFYCQDLIDGILLAAQNPHSIGETYMLGSETSVTELQIGEAMAGAMGITPRRIRVPHIVVYSLAAVSGVYGMLTRKPMIFNFQKAHEVVQPSWTCSVEKARRQLGFRTKVSLETGMLLTYRWYREAGWL